MDLETENRIAAILLKEAEELRRQAEREGVYAYLRQPKVRGRPNSRFLTATVLGVQQANRAVEVNELWRVRQKELELDDKLNGRSRPGTNSMRSHREVSNSLGDTNKRHAPNENNGGASSSQRPVENYYSREDEGLRDEEVEKFLHSRVKRGRGAVGSRMDETGPYLPSCSASKEKSPMGLDVREHLVFGPERPALMKYCESSQEEADDRRKKAKKRRSRSSDTHSRRHRTKEESKNKKKPRDKKKKRKEEKSKH